MKLNVAFCSEKGPIRSINADAVLVDESIGFFAIADGVGSAKESAAASAAAVRFARSRFCEMLQRICGSVDVNRLIAQIQDDYDNSFGSLDRIPCTTLTVAIIRDEKIHYFNIGDSPVFLLTDRTQLLTRRHTLIDKSQNFSDFSAMKSINGSNVLFNYLGARTVELITYPAVALPPKCRVLLCTDGLAEFVKQTELQLIHRRCATAQSFVAELSRRGAGTSPSDNFSVIAIDVRD